MLLNINCVGYCWNAPINLRLIILKHLPVQRIKALHRPLVCDLLKFSNMNRCAFTVLKWVLSSKLPTKIPYTTLLNLKYCFLQMKLILGDNIRH